VTLTFDEPFPELWISLLREDTPDRFCVTYPDRLYKQFTTPHPSRPEYGAYQNGCSIIVLPETFEEYWAPMVGHHTDHEVRRAKKAGYSFAIIDRDRYLDDIYEINTSLDERQGVPMSDGYRQRVEPFGPLPHFGCPRHQLRTYGVLKEDRLVAYTWVYQCGEMCLYSQILGHGEHLRFGIMRLLLTESVRDLIAVAGTKYAMYNMHDSGTEGLRFFKERLGFRPYWVNWQLAHEPVPARTYVPVQKPAARPTAGRTGIVRRAIRRLRRDGPVDVGRDILRRIGVTRSDSS
jgi:hypothetical protein